MLDECGFINMGFSGLAFTWSNNREGRAKIWERLDRAWCNEKFKLLAPNATIEHLPRTDSNHHPILLRWNENTKTSINLGQFRVEISWFRRPDFQELVK